MISVHLIKMIKESYIKPQKNKEIVFCKKKNWCGLGWMRKSCKLIRCRISPVSLPEQYGCLVQVVPPFLEGYFRLPV